MDNIEYKSVFCVSPYEMEIIEEFKSTELYKILNKTSNEEQVKQIKRYIL